MKSITLGNTIEKTGTVSLDLGKLLASRLLVQATSGAGKSWFLRRLIEQAGPYIQTIVLDPEGEFATLREQLDMVLIGQPSHGAEIAADVKTATVLARRLVELRTSAVIDLLELDRHQRAAYVRDFLSSLIAIPKDLYRPILVVIDEAHGLCPEQSESVATAAVIRLMDLGRKRGLCGILATQRLSKLDKDAAAECGNILIGRTSPIDIKRAADLLGLPQAERNSFTRLGDGEWLAFGPALTGPTRDDGVYHFKAGDTKTSHPKAGQHHKLTTPAASDAIKRVLPELADLARKDGDDPLTVEEAKTQVKGMRKKIGDLERQLATRPTQTAVQVQEKIVEVPVLKNGQLDRTEKIIERVDAVAKSMQEKITELRNSVIAAKSPSRGTFPATKPASVPNVQSRPAKQAVSTGTLSRPSTASVPAGLLPIGERKVLSALIQYPAGLHREQLTVLTAYKRSSRDAYIQRLREKGFVDTAGDRIAATQAGIESLPDAEPLPTGEALQSYWLNRLPTGERAMLEPLIAAYPEAVDRDALSDSTGYKRSSRDAYLQRLSAKELVEDAGRGSVKASANLFESEGA